MILCLKIANILTDIVRKFLINQISGRGSKTTFCMSETHEPGYMSRYIYIHILGFMSSYV